MFALSQLTGEKVPLKRIFFGWNTDVFMLNLFFFTFNWHILNNEKVRELELDS